MVALGVCVCVAVLLCALHWPGTRTMLPCVCQASSALVCVNAKRKQRLLVEAQSLLVTLVDLKPL